MFWFEEILQFGIISRFLCAMGILIIVSKNGRQKYIGNHMWDVDKKLVEK
ncbi:hypothetical protein MKX03_001237 [Papaver bracteatum]|nr:hypothetical protein MKX03_001237 [Papaver bracteatum]